MLEGILALGAASNIIIGIIRWIFFVIDGIVYSFAALTYQIAISMYSLDEIIPSGSIVTTTAKIIYSFLAIYMFFKLAFSLLEMLVDPSKIDDKQKGVSKLVRSVVICLALIALVPTIFEYSKKIQGKVIDEHLIEKAIYGDNYNDDVINNLGNKMALATWSVFLKPSRNTIVDNVMEGEAIEGFQLKIFSNGDSLAERAWKNVFSQEGASRTFTLKLLPLFAVLNEKTLYVAGNYDLSYLIIISTAAGIYLLWTFIKLSIDIAYRAIKMIFLEIVSPIAIISYINPKSADSGLFSKWLKETVKTYLSLFIKIFVFALASILMMEYSENWEYAKVTGQGLTVLLAIIAFVKNAPAFIDKLFGTELSKASETKFVTDFLRGGIGAVSNAAVGGISSAIVAKRNNLPVGQAAWKGVKKGFTSGYASAKKGSILDYGKGVYSGIAADDTRGFYGLPTKAEREKAAEKDRRIREMLSSTRSGESAKTVEVNRLNANNGREITNFMNGNEISKNGYKFRMQNGFTDKDAVASGAVIKYHSTMATNRYKGYSNKGIYDKEAKANLEAEIAKRTYDNANTYYSMQMGKSEADKQSELIAHYGDLASAQTALGTSNIEAAFTKVIEQEIVVKTGCSLSELENVSNKAQGDATQAKTGREEYEASNAGVEDKIKRESYEAAKRGIESGRY